MSNAFPVLTAGLELALAYNPTFAAVFAAATAMLASRPGRPARAAGAVFVLIVGWLLGDGMRIIVAARDLADDAGSLLPDAAVGANWAVLAVWAVGGFALGYALPAWAGAFVGRRVTWGTGWIAAIAVSVSTSAIVAALTSALARSLG